MGRSNEVGLDNLVPRQCDLQNEGNSVAMETNGYDNVLVDKDADNVVNMVGWVSRMQRGGSNSYSVDEM